jgi:hypothetical protein
MSTVIYAIECHANGSVYVGLSRKLTRRWNRHRSDLRRGVHAVAGMSADFRTHGERAFETRVLEMLPRDTTLNDAQKAELRWQVHFARLGRLYNPPTCVLCHRPLESGESALWAGDALDSDQAGPHAQAELCRTANEAPHLAHAATTRLHQTERS